MANSTHPVQIKGQKDGLWIILDDATPVHALVEALEDKLSSSNNFFAGAEVTIHAGSRNFSPNERSQLKTILEERYGLGVKEIQENVPPLGKVPASKDLVNAHIGQSGEADTPVAENIEPQRPLYDVDDDIMKALDETFWISVRPPRMRQEPESDEQFYEGDSSTLYFRGTVRSGQSLEYPGNIVILGDVNPGAYVIASGDIIVMGRLNGVVHAGAEGEERAVVVGASFFPSQLRIAQYIGRPPDEYPQARGGHGTQTEKASIKDGSIVIEPIV